MSEKIIIIITTKVEGDGMLNSTEEILAVLNNDVDKHVTTIVAKGATISAEELLDDTVRRLSLAAAAEAIRTEITERQDVEALKSTKAKFAN